MAEKNRQQQVLNKIRFLESGSKLLCMFSDLGVSENEMAMVMNSFKAITDPVQASRTMTTEDVDALDDNLEQIR